MRACFTGRRTVRICAVLLAAVLVFSGCGLLGSLGQNQTGDMPRFSEIQYVRPDLAAITQDFETLIADLEADRLPLGDAVAALQKCYDSYDAFYTMENVAELRYYHDVTDDFYADETDWFFDNEPEMDRLFEALCSASANCADAEALDKTFWGGWVVEAYQGRDNAKVDPTYAALVRQENAVLSEYRRAMSDPTVNWRGQERSYLDLRADPNLSEEEWNEIRALYYDKYSDLLGGIYIRLVEARQAQAAYFGFDSYEEYAYAAYDRDYTPAQGMTLVEEIRKELAPLYEELSIHTRWEEQTYTEVTKQEIFSALSRAALEMGGVIRSAFEDMEAYELYDIDISEKKGDVSFQCYLYAYDNPFIFVKTEGFSDDILSFGHEFGHFVDAWFNHNATSSQDLCEVFSLGMEYLLLDRLPDRFREELTSYKLLDTLDTFTQQASFAAFEHEVYARPAAEWTPDELAALSLRLAEEFGYLEPGKETYYAKSWIDITHFFDNPFYVISYCTANDAAFRIYELECRTPGSGLTCWNEMLHWDEDSFMKTVTEKGGLEDPFGAESVRSVAALIREKLS